jgi:xylitol oxidase
MGTGHSFDDIADTTGDLISLADLPATIDIDAQRSTVTVPAGVTYAELCPRLQAAGFALPALASLPHISIAGACATGTHGSGNTVGNLAAAVTALDLVTADGELLRLSRDADRDRLLGSVVGLGVLGIATQFTLDIIPSFDIEQYVYENMPTERFYEAVDDIFGAAYSVSVFTDWNDTTISQVWLKRRAGERPPGRSWLGAVLADGQRHPLLGHSPGNCTVQCGQAGPWHERLPHFRTGFTPSSGQELQSEYFVARGHAADAVRAVHEVAERFRPVLQISELRTVAADELWLSPSHHRESLAIHFTWEKDRPAVAAALPVIEEALAAYDARPHWGKLFQIGPDELARRYERWDAFAALRRAGDPDGKFHNAWADRVLGPI